jgi:hypothetical protein
MGSWRRPSGARDFVSQSLSRAHAHSHGFVFSQTYDRPPDGGG